TCTFGCWLLRRFMWNQPRRCHCRCWLMPGVYFGASWGDWFTLPCGKAIIWRKLPPTMNQSRIVDQPLSSLRQGAIEVIQRLQSAGFAAYWAGGCVRDALLGVEPNDFDIATEAVPEQIERIFPEHIAVGRQFGVLVVPLS